MISGGERRVRNRWIILAILFAVRFTMAFQFQSVAAVAPLLTRDFGVGLAEIGFLIGLYFTPGVVLALPGGAIGKRFGDKRVTLASLVLMTAGCIAMALGKSWDWQIAGRLVAGAGGVLLNVQLTKMLTDWFAGREIATAMAIFVNSWPTGIALALLVLPAIGAAHGVAAVYLTVTALIAIGIALAAVYRPPDDASVPASVSSGRPDLKTLELTIIAGLIWGLFNVGFAMIFSFGPSMLVERGWSIGQAGSAVSIVLWLSVISVPAGGWLADRFKRPQAMLVFGSILCAIAMLALAQGSPVIASMIVLGSVAGLPVGAIMSLPARVLTPATRAIGMGVFYAVYYVAMMLGTTIGGGSAKWMGTAAAAFDLGAIAMAACPLLLWLFNQLAGTRQRAT
jgi:predicted MFS family arabinose efflux permease